MDTLDKRVNAKALYTQLTSHFRERILDGRLPAGTRLPTELELAAQYDISRGTVRQAMSVLVSEGLLERKQGRGTFVRTLPWAQGAETRAVEQCIGLVLNDPGDQLNMKILVGAEHAAKSRGYQVSFTYAEQHLGQQARDIERLVARRVAGMIIFPISDVTYDESIWRLQSTGVPFVLVDRYFPDLDTDYVTADNLDGGYRATEHLLILGHKRIGFVYPSSATLLTTSVRDRWKGYCKALQDYGLPYDEILVFQRSHMPYPDAGHTYTAFLSQPDRPSAVFTVNDREALALMQTAQRLGMRVPEDLALVGFDDLSYTAHLCPPLTTMAQPSMEVGLRAGHLLIDRIEGHIGPTRHIELPTKLIVRESCGARLRVRRSLSSE